MVKAQESLVPHIAETEDTIQEYVKKIALALEKERETIKEQANQDYNQIIAKAREEGDRILNQARQEAKAESNALISELKDKGDQILRESREKAFLEARQESARIIGETIEKTAQIITELIERGITQAENEFIRVASEARNQIDNEKSKLLALTKGVEPTINETEASMQSGIDNLTIEIKKNEPVNEIPHREPEMSPLNIAMEIDKPKHTEKLEKQENEQAAGEGPRLSTSEIKETEDSQTADMWMQKGIFLLDSGEYKEALKVFTKVIEIEPNNALAWRKKGAALGTMGRNREALEVFKRAIELEPNDPVSWHNKSVALANLGQKKEAKEALEVEKRVKKEAERATKM